MRQPWPRRVRGVCKWSGTVATLFLSLVSIVSARGSRYGVVVSPSLDLSIVAGRLCIETYASPRTKNELPPYVPDVFVERRIPPQTFEWWFEMRQWSDVRLYSTEVFIPLWAIVLLAGLPTIWLWCHDRKQPGVCTSCGYDLRGADHAACPECGAVITSRATT